MALMRRIWLLPLATALVAAAAGAGLMWSRGHPQATAAVSAACVLAALLGLLALRRIARQIDATLLQARTLLGGELIIAPEPHLPELQLLARAMNLMVARVKTNFEAQSAQVEQLRQLAQCDPLTGLANRAHFLAQLQVTLQREDGTDEGGLVLLRVLELDAINQRLGRAATDRVLRAIAQALLAYSERVEGCFPGRLNGADFALCLPVAGLARETAQALAAALRGVLPAFGARLAVAFGAMEVQRDMLPTKVLAEADAALARAESRGAFAVELASENGGVGAGLGEADWRERINDALGRGRAQLASFALIDSAHSLIHLECPLRLELLAGGGFDVAARWLPLAVRTRLTAAVDERAVQLALEAIRGDGQARCVNLAPASLADSGFIASLRRQLFAAPPAARKLSLEVAETAAVEHFSLVQELGRQLRPCGVRLGLEHAGSRLHQIERLFEVGLDFVKLDAATTVGVASDPRRASFVRSTAAMLHGMSLHVYAEGVVDADDAMALWHCGIDGITGPWVSGLQARAGG